MPQTKNTLVILGGTSAVAMAYARIQAERGRRICLVGRNAKSLKANATDLAGRGAGSVVTHICDLGALDSIEKNWAAIQKSCEGMDEILLAYGILGDQDISQTDISVLRSNLETNFVSAALWSEQAFSHFAYEGRGQLTVIGSVAGDRGRQSNYHYGAAKGALEIFCDGMAHRAAQLKESKVKVLLVKPGFIDTPMTDHLDKGGPLWASPEKIGHIIDRSIERGKSKVYAPWFWWCILSLIRMTPRFVFHRTKL